MDYVGYSLLILFPVITRQALGGPWSFSSSAHACVQAMSEPCVAGVVCRMG